MGTIDLDYIEMLLIEKERVEIWLTLLENEIKSLKSVEYTNLGIIARRIREELEKDTWIKPEVYIHQEGLI